MHIDWQRLFEYIYVNRLPLSLGATAIVSAGVRTMPALIPRTAQDWWTWFSDWAHQVCNTKNDRQGQTPGK